ncbi:heat-inducible transcriptional repressor HrcA [Candidatus Latescibacterota bacterium]
MNKFLERRDRIIDVVVSAFLETGEPVSSGYVAANCGIKVSSPTIRNSMKELEEEGFFAKPHTSAGRIPTVKCYRYYVKHLMKDMNLEEDDFQYISRLVKKVIIENDADFFMDHIASVISEVTDLIGVAMTPLFERAIFDRLEIMNLGGSKYLLVISLRSGLVKTINLTVNHIITRAKVDETARILTNRLSGLSVSEIKRTIGKRIKGVSGGNRNLFDMIIDNQEQIFNLHEEKDIHVAGMSRFLSHHEMEQSEYSLKIVDLVEQKLEIADVLKQTVMYDEDVNINIGGDGLWGSNPPLSLISAIYHSSDTPGVVAVIGPTRIHYPKLRAIMKYTASITSGFFSS